MLPDPSSRNRFSVGLAVNHSKPLLDLQEMLSVTDFATLGWLARGGSLESLAGSVENPPSDRAIAAAPASAAATEKAQIHQAEKLDWEPELSSLVARQLTQLLEQDNSH
jgi:hypothetical protein